jgi:hypothetical protein
LGPRTTAGDDNDLWDTIWGPRVLTLFSNHLPIHEVAKRLHPAELGFALQQRKLSADEVAFYGELLDSSCTAILKAHEPAFNTLPAIRANPEKISMGQVPEFEDDDKDTIIKNPSLTWGGNRDQGPSVDQIHELFDGEATVRKLNQRIRQRVDLVLASWRTDALQWFGRTFSDDALEHVCIANPALVKKWASLASVEGPIGTSINVRLGSFLAQLCPLLLTHQPDAGMELWKCLHRRVNGPVLFDAAFAAFRAQGDKAGQARDKALGECHDDESLSRIAYLAESLGQSKWLTATINNLISDTSTRRRALGLTLAAFSNFTIDQFEPLIFSALTAGTWLERQVDGLRQHVVDNENARYWYRRYLEHPDEHESWGSLQMFLSTGDFRFFIWRDSENQHRNSETDRRLRFLEANVELEKELDRGKKRKETLFGIQINSAEIFPFTQTSRLML